MSGGSGRLRGRTSLITGGASGLGLAIARRFSEEGAAVAIADLDEARSLEAAGELDGRALGLASDVRRPDQIEAAVERVERELGPIDVLVTCAGIGVVGPILETRLEDWNRVLDVNLTGTFLTAQAVGRRMVERGGGSIVMIGSINSRRPVALRNAYAVSKAGVLMLMWIMAMELGRAGVRVNGLAPGPIDTPMTQAMHGEPTRRAYQESIPLGRYGTPDEVANAALFLASDESSYVSGHMIDVDGGFDAVGMILPEGA
ncbi:MAG TPA: SDR family oxidoreductase [Geminicoccaceae bacterium]